MDLVFHDDDTAIICLVGNQLIGRLKCDIVDIAPELSHQISAPLGDTGPPGEVVENFEGNAVGDGVEEMLASQKSAAYTGFGRLSSLNLGSKQTGINRPGPSSRLKEGMGAFGY